MLLCVMPECWLTSVSTALCFRSRLGWVYTEPEQPTRILTPLSPRAVPGSRRAFPWSFNPSKGVIANDVNVYGVR